MLQHAKTCGSCFHIIQKTLLLLHQLPSLNALMSQSRICAEEGFAQVQRLEAKDLRLSWNWLKLGLGLAVELKRAQARGSQLNCNGLMPKLEFPQLGSQNRQELPKTTRVLGQYQFFLQFYEHQSSNDYELERHDPQSGSYYKYGQPNSTLA